MPHAKPNLAILGGGIHGTAIAALIAQSGFCKVTLFERGRIASGITSTNQGRLHTGTRIWRTCYDSVAKRRRLGADLICQLPGVVVGQEQGIYLIEADEDVELFENACQRRLISYKCVSPSFVNDSWVLCNRQFAAVYEVPEYSFNPARLAGVFASYAKNRDVEILTQSAVQSIEIGEPGKFCLQLTNGDTFYTNMIVNALGNWGNQIRSNLPLPQLDLQWHRRRLLGLFTPSTSAQLSLKRVITIIDKDKRIPGAIPHDSWIIFGSDVNIERLQSPDDGDTDKWQQFDENRAMDHLLFETHVDYFSPLRYLGRSEISQRLFSIAGVYPHLDNEKVSDFQIHQNNKVPGYYLIAGGNATTALLDAMDLVDVVLSHLSVPQRWSRDKTAQLVKNLVDGFAREERFPKTAGMIWEGQVPGTAKASE